ncbi:MAG: gliding motility-associated ABC transporter permease subunit GldF [Bacteroidales bacterium]|jgi:ABC-2 type transport system permease protein|nr:gliding motility-associated ABC transporter permease subunit GldF [Bacteroidales bacterium]
MWVIFSKEIKGFFSSLAGYVVMIVFLLMNSLFMWVLPGQMNVLETGYATLESLFALAPWAFLFLVPAITMKMFAEEKRMGTLELLYTRPVTELQIVLAKFLAAWVLVLLSLIPTLVFFWSVYTLGSIPGNIDMGGTWGSYIGLFFLGGIYTAIGVFASSLTDNQIVAFIAALIMSFIMYLGFDSLGVLAGSGQLNLLVSKLGIDQHYNSISRGVLDSRDLLYFIGVIGLFVMSTRLVLQRNKW